MRFPEDKKLNNCLIPELPLSEPRQQKNTFAKPSKRKPSAKSLSSSMPAMDFQTKDMGGMKGGVPGTRRPRRQSEPEPVEVNRCETVYQRKASHSHGAGQGVAGIIDFIQDWKSR